VNSKTAKGVDKGAMAIVASPKVTADRERVAVPDQLEKSSAPKPPPRLDPSEAVPVHTRFAPDISCPNSSWEIGSASVPSVRSVQLLAIVTPSVRLYGTVACVSRDAALVVELESRALYEPDRPAAAARAAHFAMI
jgi:hypothetical protein